MKNLFLISLLIIPLDIFCCSFGFESFCTTVNKNDGRAIVYGTIISKDDNGLDLEVIEVLKGDENRTQIRIWDGLDFDCNGPFDMSVNTIGEINDTILITLPKIDSIVNPWDVIGDYTTPIPYGATPRLFVIEGMTIGFLTTGSDTPFIEYEKLREAIEDGGDCTDLLLISNTNNPTTQNEINIINPASSTLSIIQSHASEIEVVNIYSLSGEKLITTRTEDQLQIAISIELLPANLYIIQMIKSDNTQKIVKLVKS